jgi:hypothetical protein
MAQEPTTFQRQRRQRLVDLLRDDRVHLPHRLGAGDLGDHGVRR